MKKMVIIFAAAGNTNNCAIKTQWWLLSKKWEQRSDEDTVSQPLHQKIKRNISRG